MRHRTRAALLASALASFSCTGRPPAPAPVRAATSVEASFDKTWNAAIDQLADANIPIATTEKASGVIVAYPLSVPWEDRFKWADCGVNGAGNQVPAVSVIYNVLVRGDTAQSTVKVTASWFTNTRQKCSTKGGWETEAEKAIKDRAEGK